MNDRHMPHSGAAVLCQSPLMPEERVVGQHIDRCISVGVAHT